MAKLPTIEETIRAILDAAQTYNPRPGEIIPLMGVQMKVGTRFVADDLNKAFEEMGKRGWVEGSGNFFKLTEAGFAEM
ncbi:hypothetical protein FM111_13475 [Brevundimonas diminuta 3F5N]|uniref:Uncharacterized protein n=1 Tax=Brevundimonas diminuta 3F5N TaxID=1255603 RepID=A0A1R4GK75_BREDI|nr:hypothetical protein [Brevundimonas diminuta]SJM68621.1 hypothetical protein FM111_13475 [Brevundimonas diminuta 3F5N]